MKDRFAHTQLRRLAQQYGIQFFEVSALNGQNVEPLFHDLAKRIADLRITDEAPQDEGADGQDGTIRLESPAAGGSRARPTKLKKGMEAMEEKCCS